MNKPLLIYESAVQGRAIKAIIVLPKAQGIEKLVTKLAQILETRG